MIDPILWLVLSFLLVSMSLTAVLVVLVPAVRELSRAARSVERLCETLNRELPPTLESIRLTSLEITELTDDMAEGVQNASRVVHQVDQSVVRARHQAQRVQVSTRSLMVGLRAAWKTFTQPQGRDSRRLPQGAAAKYVSSQPSVLTPGDNRCSQESRSAAGDGHRSPAPPRHELPPGSAPATPFAPAQPTGDLENAPETKP